MTPRALPAILDVEASGFGRGSYPIEVGFVLGSGLSFCTLVRPQPDWTHWDEAAAQVHGLSRELLQRHGRPVPEVARLLNQHLAGQTVYCDGWAHDYPWIATLYDAAGARPAFTLGHVRTLLDEDAAARWDEACAEIRRKLHLQRHRASTDARVIQLALGRLGGAGRVTLAR